MSNFEQIVTIKCRYVSPFMYIGANLTIENTYIYKFSFEIYSDALLRSRITRFAKPRCLKSAYRLSVDPTEKCGWPEPFLGVLLILS